MPLPVEHILPPRQFVAACAAHLLATLRNEESNDSDIRAAAQGLDSSIRVLAKADHSSLNDMWDVAEAMLCE